MSVDRPEANRDYPGTYGDMRAWFSTDAACLEYLEWLRWGDGFSCPRCESAKAWKLPDGRWSCGGCRRRVSVTAGTIFHGTRTPLTLWLAAAWHMTSQKNGISALGLKRVLDLGSMQTAWALLRRFRTAMVRPGRERLAGQVEVDEAFFGGPEPGRSGRGALGKTLVAIAVEVGVDGSIAGRCRMCVIPDAEGPTLRTFVEDNIEPGSLVVTDGWTGYQVACEPPCRHDRSAISRQTLPAHELLPAVHRVAGLTKRWLLGAHQGGVKPKHLQAYLNEFAFRFNRRESEARGMLFYRLLEIAVRAEPRTFRSLVAMRRRVYFPAPQLPPPDKRVHADSLERAPLDRPWRTRRASGEVAS